MYTIYSKDDCRYCVKAKEDLDNLNLKYTEIKLGRDILNREDFINEIMKKTGTRPDQVPQIFKGSVHIGGQQELANYLTKVNEK